MQKSLCSALIFLFCLTTHASLYAMLQRGSWTNAIKLYGNRLHKQPFATMTKMGAHYVLGAAPGAPWSEVLARYKNLCKLYHPDVNPTREKPATQRFQEIRQAFDLLKKEYPEAQKHQDSGFAKEEAERILQEQKADYERWSQQQTAQSNNQSGRNSSQSKRSSQYASSTILTKSRIIMAGIFTVFLAYCAYRWYTTQDGVSYRIHRAIKHGDLKELQRIKSQVDEDVWKSVVEIQDTQFRQMSLCIRWAIEADNPEITEFFKSRYPYHVDLSGHIFRWIFEVASERHSKKVMNYAAQCLVNKGQQVPSDVLIKLDEHQLLDESLVQNFKLVDPLALVEHAIKNKRKNLLVWIFKHSHDFEISNYAQKFFPHESDLLVEVAKELRIEPFSPECAKNPTGQDLSFGEDFDLFWQKIKDQQAQRELCAEKQKALQSLREYVQKFVSCYEETCRASADACMHPYHLTGFPLRAVLQGAEVNLTVRRSLLDIAVQENNLAVVALLIKMGANPIKTNGLGKKPADYAQSLEMIQLLHKFGSDISGHTLFHRVINNEIPLSAVAQLPEIFTPNAFQATNKFGSNAWHLAAWRCAEISPRILDALIRHKVQHDKKNKEGLLPVDIASKQDDSNCRAMVELLKRLKNQANTAATS